MPSDSQFTQDLGLNDSVALASAGNAERNCSQRQPARASALSEGSSALTDASSTQPFSPGHIEARLSTGQHVDLDWSKLSVESLTLPDRNARILVLPKVHGLSVVPFGGTSGFNSWVEVTVADDADEPLTARLLTIAPNSEQLGFSILHDPLACTLFFDPSHNRLVLRNTASSLLLVAQLGDVSPTPVPRFGTFELPLGVWSISTQDECIVQLKVLERLAWPVTTSLSAKRSIEDSPTTSKRSKLSSHHSAPRVGTLQAVARGHALLALENRETLHVGTGTSSYQLTRLADIADQRRSTVWRASYSRVHDKDVVVKIIKAANVDPLDTVKAAQAWMRELSIHSSLESHPDTILQLLGSDARFHSIYTEHVDAKSLAFHVKIDGTFNGGLVDAWKVMADTASALSFVHASRIVHNDIKPANILYSPIRGAVLIDFGLSFVEGQPLRDGGTPWYLAPEFGIDSALRNTKSDVWALGVVMLWLVGHIRIPERSRGWIIADVHTRGSPEPRQREAVNAMNRWHSLILGQASALKNDVDHIEGIVKTMLVRDYVDRSAASTVLDKISESTYLDD